MEELKFFTLPLKHGQGTITYLVKDVKKDEAGKVTILLTHPLSKEILIPFAADSMEQLILSQTQTQGKSNEQRWVEYIVKNSTELDYDIRRDAEGLGILFTINKSFTNKEKRRLSRITGRIATTYFNSDLQLAMRYIKDNEAILDEYNKSWFSYYVERGNKLSLKKSPFAPHEREAIFNIAGFALSQQDSDGGQF